MSITSSIVKYPFIYFKYDTSSLSELHKAYREKDKATLPTNDEQKVQMFILMTSKSAKQNLIPFSDKKGLNAI
ncbi:M60 family metallopeptidase [Paenibacillus sp. NAIST15-1]|uniref:M60 family metallopeptidase n=1 Tax=Paenibacillus sp. NAIST15-1 TaxID=1605994 RepID=UPI000933B6D2